MSHLDDCNMEMIVVSGYIHQIEPMVAYNIIPRDIIELCHQFYTLCIDSNSCGSVVDHELGLFIYMVSFIFINKMIFLLLTEEIVNAYQLKRGDTKFQLETGRKLMEIVLNIGTNIIEKEVKDILSQSLIHLHHKFRRIITDEFDGEYLFLLAIKNAFESIMNEANDVSIALALFCDNILRNSSSYHPLSNLENTMKHIAMLYGYIRDKDRFQYIYKHHLNSRLLPLTTNTSFSRSMQNEMRMMSLLKSQHRSYWTTKIEHMLLEINESKSYFQRDSEMKSNEMEIDLRICGRKWWSDKALVTNCTNWILPKDLMGIYMDIEEIYLQKYKDRRKLMLQMDKGTAEMKIEFNKHTIKTLVLSTYQMAILLLFNDKDVISFGEMKQLTGIHDDELYVSVVSMAHPKIKILKKKPNDKHIADHHTFQINSKYQNKKDRIKVPTLQFPKYNTKIYMNRWRIQKKNICGL